MGLAYLSNGARMDYKEYIKTPDWQKVRKARYKFDAGRCVVCHKQFAPFEPFHTHHLNYMHLGQEHIRDVVTMCDECHTKFHNVWVKNNYWKGKESGHWEAFSLEHTATMCAAYYKEDRFICKNINAPNLCNTEVARQYMDKYMKDFNLDTFPYIDANDFILFVRNKRWEMFFEAESRGLNLEEFLDECYGLKVRGKNPIRQAVGSFYKHKPESMHMHYSENPNINKLMSVIKEREEI